MDELWVKINGFERYQVSNFGRIKNTKGEIMFTCLNRKGYVTVRLYTGHNKVKSFLVHRLVANHFIPNPENKPQVNHKNGIKTDNNILNLEWNTQSENTKHSFQIGLQTNKGENHPLAKFTNEDIFQIRAYCLKWTGFNHGLIGDIFDCSKDYIQKINRRRLWNHI